MKPLKTSLKYQKIEKNYSANTENKHSKPLFWSTIEKIWQFLIKNLMESPEIQVWHAYDDEGNIWWSAYNPVTKQSICRISEEQMRVWIERRYR